MRARFDVVAQAQAQMMKQVQELEDRVFFWELGVAAMKSGVDHIENDVLAIYMLILKYNADASSRYLGNNRYEIKVYSHPVHGADYAFTYILEPKCLPTK